MICKRDGGEGGGRERQTDRQRQTGRQTETERQADRQTGVKQTQYYTISSHAERCP